MCLEKSERQKLEAAIDRLSRRKWCDDAMLALEAARKHLATLPEDRRPLYRAYQTGVATQPKYADFDTRRDAQEWARSMLAVGADMVNIEPY